MGYGAVWQQDMGECEYHPERWMEEGRWLVRCDGRPKTRPGVCFGKYLWRSSVSRAVELMRHSRT